MEKLVELAQDDITKPSECLFVAFNKYFTKGIIETEVNYLKDCVKLVNGLAETEEGIDDMLEYKEKTILKSMIKSFNSVKKKSNEAVVEDMLEIFHVIAETSEEGNELLLSLTPDFIGFVVDNSEQWKFSIRLEACKLLNLLIESTSSITNELKESISYQQFIKSFGTCLMSAGDYELQATLMEALFRLVSIDEKCQLIKQWFSTTQLQNSFMAIRNEDFETDCRRFLNQFNGSHADKQRVYSVPVACINLGRYQLKKPKDSKITDFWLDFNIDSCSISTFVDDESSDEDNSDWEMVCIKKEMVRDFRVNLATDKTILILKLYEPSCTLVPFAPQASETYVKINFERQYNVTPAIEKLFGHVKYVELPISSPSISSTPAHHMTGRASSAITALMVRGKIHERQTIEAAQDQTISSSKHSPEENVSKLSVANELLSDEKVKDYADEEKSVIPADEKSSIKPSKEEKNSKNLDEIKDNVKLTKLNKSSEKSTEAKSKSKPVKVRKSEIPAEDEVVRKSIEVESKTKNKETRSSERNSFQQENTANEAEIAETPSAGILPDEKSALQKINSGRKTDIPECISDSKNSDVIIPESNPVESIPQEIDTEVTNQTIEMVENDDQNISKDEQTPDQDEREAIEDNEKEAPGQKSLDPVDFNIIEHETKALADEKEAGNKVVVKKPKKSFTNKKVKKLLSSNFQLFQDSPDDTYKVVPIKIQPKLNTKPKILKDEKPITKKMIKHQLTAEEKAAFDFDELEDEEQQEATLEKQVKPVLKPARGRSKKQKEDTSKLKNEVKLSHDKEEKQITTRSGRRSKKVNYKEPTSDNFEQINKEEDKSTEDIKDSDENIKEPKDTKGRKKSVSFVSPLEETSYFEVESDYVETPDVLEQQRVEAKEDAEENILIELKKKDEIPPELKLNEKIKLNRHKQERVAEWTRNLLDTDTDDSVEGADDEVVSADVVASKETEVKLKNESSKLTTPKGREQNNKSKKNQQRDSFDFTESETSSAENEVENKIMFDTPWSKQKAKKDKIKTEYKVQKGKNRKLIQTKNKIADSQESNSSKNGISSRRFYSSSKEEKQISKDKNQKNIEVKEQKRKAKETEKQIFKRPKLLKAIEVSDYESSLSSQESKNSYSGIVLEGIDTELVVETVTPPQGSCKPGHYFDQVQSPIKSSTMEKQRNKKKKKEQKNKQTNVKTSSKDAEPADFNILDDSADFMNLDDVEDLNLSTNNPNISKQTNVDQYPEGSPLSSFEASSKPPMFMDDTPMGSKSKSMKWAQDLNQVFENIEAVSAMKPIKKKLWKSPVVLVKEDEISQDLRKQKSPSVIEGTKNKQKKALPQKHSRVISEPTTPLMPPSQEEKLNNFALFCKNMLEKSSCNNNSMDQYTEVGNESETCSPTHVSPKNSPPLKKKKIINETVEDEAPPSSIAPTLISDEKPKTKAGSSKTVLPKLDDIEVSRSCQMLEYDDVSTNEIMKKYLSYSGPQNINDDESDDMGDIVYKSPIKEPIIIPSDVGGEVQSMLQSFGSNINKTIDCKKQGLERFIGKVTKLVSNKMNTAWDSQVDLRRSVDNVFVNNWTQELDEWHTHCQTKESRLSTVLEQLQNVVKENSSEDKKRIKRLKHVVLKYHDKKEELNTQEKKVQTALQEHLRLDIKKLKANMLRQTKTSEITNIRRSLRAMLHNV